MVHIASYSKYSLFVIWLLVCFFFLFCHLKISPKPTRKVRIQLNYTKCSETIWRPGSVVRICWEVGTYGASHIPIAIIYRYNENCGPRDCGEKEKREGVLIIINYLIYSISFIHSFIHSFVYVVLKLKS